MAGQVWTTPSLGGNLSAPVLSQKVRLSAIKRMRFRQFTRLEGQFGKNFGDTMQYKKAGPVQTQGRIISENETVPETQITIYTDNITVNEYSNSIPYTERVEMLARLSITDIIVQRLRDDMANVLDQAVFQIFAGADLVYTPTGSSVAPANVIQTTGSAGAQATRGILLFDVKEIVDQLKSTYTCPFYDANDNYLAVASTQFLRGLKDDKEVVEAQKYGDPDRLFKGEVGRIYGARFCEESNVLSNSLANGCGEAIFFGEDPVIEIIARAETIQAKVGVDYDRDKGLRWVYYGGFARTWTYSEAAQVRILHVTST